MLVHPDKNMCTSLASESFKKLQCAYEVSSLASCLYDCLILSWIPNAVFLFIQILSDAVKKRDYDEQLKKEESKCAIQKSGSKFSQVSIIYNLSLLVFSCIFYFEI